MKDLIEKILDLLEEYKDKKIGNIEIDTDTDFEIHKQIEYAGKMILEVVDQLDEDIDTMIEQMNEPSDTESWNNEYESMRYKEMR